MDQKKKRQAAARDRASSTSTRRTRSWASKMDEYPRWTRAQRRRPKMPAARVLLILLAAALLAVGHAVGVRAADEVVPSEADVLSVADSMTRMRELLASKLASASRELSDSTATSRAASPRKLKGGGGGSLLSRTAAQGEGLQITSHLTCGC